MAAPMQHVGKMCYRSFSAVYGHLRGRSNGCHPQMIYVLNQFNTFSSKSNEFSSQNDFYGIVEESQTDTSSQKRGLTDKQLYQKYAYKQREKTDVLYEDVSYGGVCVEPPHRSSTSRHTKLSKVKSRNKFDNSKPEKKERSVRHKVDRYGRSDKNVSFHEESRFQEHKYGKRFSRTSDFNRKGSSKHTNDLNYVDSQYFDTIAETGSDSLSEKPHSGKDDLRELGKKRLDIEQELDYINSQYFTGKSQNDNHFSHTTRSHVEKWEQKKFDLHMEKEDLNFIDQQYFDTDLQGVKTPPESFCDRNADMSIGRERMFVRTSSMEEGVYSAKWNKTRKDENVTNQKNADDCKKMESKKEKLETAFDVALEIRKRIKSSANKEDENEDKPRLYHGPVDSKGFRILKNQVPDVMNTPSAMVVKLLKDNIIYNRENIIAIEKPYGLPSHGGPGVHMSVGQLLPSLARLVDPSGQLETLHLVHRLDKQTTGVMLLAKTAEMAWQLHGAFRRREVVKKYWVLTKGVPKPEQGVIDIPIAEGTVGSFHRMVLKPEATYDTRLVTPRSTMETHQAITQYKVLDSHGPAALVECTPLSGAKHQIRVHMAFGLNTPILGDHKYSHISKVAPQRLHPELLQRLGIRQSKVRHLPMMLHAKSLLLPEFLEGRNIFISSRLPPHFRINMNRLKIKPKKHN